MSDRPRRRPVPTITPPSFDDERPTSVTATATATSTDPAKEMDPEPPTMPAISITAPSFAEAAKTGPFGPGREREGSARTVAERVSAPARVAPETRTEIASPVQDRESPPPAAAPPQAPRRPRVDLEARPTEASAPVALPAPAPSRAPFDPETASTVLADPWEYLGATPAEAAALAADYDSGGVELDTSGRLVAPGLKPKRPRKQEESDPGVSPADLLSVALEVWPDEPPPRPASPLPQVEPVVAPPPRPAGPLPRVEPVAPPPRPASPPPRMETVETLLPREPPAAPRELLRRPTPKAPVLKPSSLAHADTVLRAPRSADFEEGWFDKPAPDRNEPRHARDEPDTGEHHHDDDSHHERYDDDPTASKRYGDDATASKRYGDDATASKRYDQAPPDEHYDEQYDEQYDEEPGHQPYDDEGYDDDYPPDEEAGEEDESLDGETRIKGAVNRRRKATSNRRKSRNRRAAGPDWTSAFLKLLLLGLAAVGIWLWYTRR